MKDGNVGYAVVGRIAGGWIEQRGGLDFGGIPSRNWAFDAELYANLKATWKFASIKEHNPGFTIFSDSQSGVLRCKND
jgi:hypothetical protein